MIDKKMKKIVNRILIVLLVFVMGMGAFSCGRLVITTPDDNIPPIVVETKFEDFQAKVDSSIYADSSIKDTKYGLNNPDKVGIIKDEIIEKYPSKPDSEFLNEAVLVFGNEVADDTAEMIRVLTDAKTLNLASKQSKIKLPNRPIRIRSDLSSYKGTHHTFELENYNGLYIEGQENTRIDIVVETVWRGAFQFTNSKNVHFNNVTIDYPISPVITGVVDSVDKENLIVNMTVSDAFDSTIDAYISNPVLMADLMSYIEFSGKGYDENGKFLSQASPRAGGSILTKQDNQFEFFTVEKGKATVKFKSTYSSTFATKFPLVGNSIALATTMYGKTGMRVVACEDFYIENFGISVAPGMGIDIESHNVYINRLNIVPTRQRLMTTTADGLHVRTSTGEVFITNSRFENMHDDALNIKSGYFYSLVTPVNPDNDYIDIKKDTETIPTPKKGEKLEVYRRSDLELVTVFTVEVATTTASGFRVKIKEIIDERIDYSNCAVTNVSLVPKVIFKNNFVANKRNRGIIISTRNVLIENNTLMNIVNGAFQICGGLGIYNEATISRDVILRNNKLIHNSYIIVGTLAGDIAVTATTANASVGKPGTIRNITIENNYIAEAGLTGVMLAGVSDAAVADNLFYNLAGATENELLFAAIVANNCEKIRVSGNYNFSNIGLTGYSGVAIGGSTQKGFINITDDNYKMNFQELEGEIIINSVSLIEDSSIIIDGDVNDWQSIGTDIELNGHSLATGAQIDPSEYANGFGIPLKKIAFSSTGLYIAFRIIDDTIDFKTIHNFYGGDCVEIFMSSFLENPSVDMQQYKELGDVMQLGMGVTNDWTLAVAKGRTNSALVEKIPTQSSHKTKLTADGYSGELFIPFSIVPEIKGKLDRGDNFGMAIVFADNDRSAINRVRLQVSNVPHFVENYKLRTVKMPRYKLA